MWKTLFFLVSVVFFGLEKYVGNFLICLHISQKWNRKQQASFLSTSFAQAFHSQFTFFVDKITVL